MNVEKRWASVPDFADEVGLSPLTVRRAIKAGEIPAVKVGRSIRIDRQAAFVSFPAVSA